MADTGAPHSIPYPIASDAPAGHTQMQSLATQVATRLGFVGKTAISATESRTNTAYGLLTTNDRVQNVVVPTDGLLEVTYWATWQESVAGAARAAIFIGANQLKTIDASSPASPGVNEALVGAGASTAIDKPLMTSSIGLVGSGIGTNTTAYTGDVTTGQAIGQITNTGSGSPFTIAALGGACRIFAAAGTYDVSVQFKSSSGSVTVKNRKLWVRVLPF